jgi:adenylate kinase family enzyme
MVKELVKQGYMNLEVNDLMRHETERRTECGLQFLHMNSTGKIIPAALLVKMLRKIIFSGQSNNKFILTNFPDVIEHVEEFEKNCATISAIFFTTKEGEVEVEFKNNNLTLFNIDSLFQKQFRLRIVEKWDEKRF